MSKGKGYKSYSKLLKTTTEYREKINSTQLNSNFQLLPNSRENEEILWCVSNKCYLHPYL
jgi:hypothetical protein